VVRDLAQLPGSPAGEQLHELDQTGRFIHDPDIMADAAVRSWQKWL
jgi:hypothetical protein